MTKQLVQYHISRLKDKNAVARLDAIRELVLLADGDALDALKEVYEKDPDEEVRRAAQQAGRDLYFKIRANSDATS
ncbi:MAG: HEAT repeat domain-containing protein [Anaerolineae bacterium]|nr:HEAT repeat domain-containing protein [Anaerolineae bacterium]